MRILRIAAVLALGAGVVAFGPAQAVGADTAGPIDFEAPAYSPGSIDGQSGWGGLAGPINPSFDQEVVSNGGSPASFGAQSWRIGTFDPSDVTGLRFWMEADFIEGLDDDDLVTDWEDQSGNDLDAEQHGGSGEPAYKTNQINGYPAVRFAADGDTFLNVDQPYSGADEATVFVVAKVLNDPPADVEHSGHPLAGWGTAPFASTYPHPDGNVYDGFGVSLREWGGNPGISLEDYHIYAVQVGAAEWRNFLNGEQQFSTTSHTISWNATPHFAWDPETSGRFDGDIVAAIGYDSVLSDPDLAAVGTYLADKYALTWDPSGGAETIVSPSTLDEAGEGSAVGAGFSGGTRQTRLRADWDFISASPTAEQSGLSIDVSPDRGDGDRMSLVRMKDTPNGLALEFVDYQAALTPGVCSSSDFVTTVVATGLDRSTPHTVSLVMDLVNGIENDRVDLYVDGIFVHHGTSWEDYFRECESNPPRTVDSLTFQSSGWTQPASDGLGFLIDNLTVKTVSPPPPSCNGLTATILGTPGPDVLTGTPGDDVIQALEGDDIVNGLGGNDAICTMVGDDTVTGGNGADLISTGDGNDRVNGDLPLNPTNFLSCGSTPAAGADDIRAGRGDDAVSGCNGSDLLNGGEGNDELRGGSGADQFVGSFGDDEITGANGFDIIDAGPDDDTVNGGGTRDTIVGGTGDDNLSGGVGDDSIRGGAGADHMSGGGATDSCNGQSGADTADATCETVVSATIV